MRIKSIIGILAVLFLVCSIFPAFADDFTNVSECMEITQSGNYRLNQSISGLLNGNDYCIGIFADDVVLDGHGFSMTGSGSDTGIIVEANNVTIINVSVSGYDYGIYFDSLNNSTIANSHISYNNEAGIRFQYSDNSTIKDCLIENNDGGIFLYYSSNNTIENSTISSSSYGITIYNSENIIISDNLILNNYDDGIYAYQSSIRVVNCTISNNGGFGIYLNYSGDNFIDNSTISNNGRAGISIDAPNNAITNCIITNNYEAGIDLGSNNNFIANNEVRNNNQAESSDYGGILLYRANDTIVLNNLITGNKIYGVRLVSSQNNTFYGNEIVDNCGGEAGIYLYEAENITFEKNNVSANTGYGFLIEFSSNITIYNNTISGNNYYGIYLEDSSSNLIYNNLFNNTNNINKLVAGIKVDTGTYKLVYLAFGFEAINSSEMRDEVMNRTLNWLGYSGQTILLVDDDSGADYESYYNNSLNNLSIAYDYWDCEVMGSPSYSDLSNYPIVVWFFGDDYEEVLNEAEIEALADYLDNGGKLFITGQDIGYYLVELGNDPEFYRNYLHAVYITDDTDILNITGVEGDPISDGLAFGISGGNGANNQEYPSGIAPADSYATPIFIYSYIAEANTWNITLQEGTNILGGNWLGGNAWLSPDGTGFSQTCADSDRNGICDTRFVIDDNNIDYLPLKYPQPVPTPPTPPTTPTPTPTTTPRPPAGGGSSSGTGSRAIPGVPIYITGYITTKQMKKAQ
ncbi:MAG: right-handed parallel beta-helix repeat-containing protein [Archaeoglobaceae archaeon]